MSEDRFWLLLSLKVSGEASVEELKELEQLLQQYPSLGFATEIIEGLWANKEEEQTLSERAFDKHLQRLSHLEENAPAPEESPNRTAAKVLRGRFAKLALGLAASILVTIGIMRWTDGKSHQTDEPPRLAKTKTVSTPKGTKSSIILPDGTRVWLNADSKLTYDENLEGPIREVSLQGEAFFDVVRDESRPFLIHALAADIKVLGTAFNVRSYINENRTETSLIRGSVLVIPAKDTTSSILLKPHQKIILYNSSNPGEDGTIVPEKTSIKVGKVHYARNEKEVIETMWTSNKLAFDAEPLGSVAMQLERWYDVSIRFTDESLKQEVFSAIFEHETIREVMEALRWSGNFHYEIVDSKENGGKTEVIISR